MFALRRLEGVDVSRFAAATGFSAEILCGTALTTWLARGYMSLADGRLCLTREGLFVSDALWPKIVKR